MNKSILATVLTADIVLAVFAIIVCNWIGSDFRFAVDSPADKIMWMLAVSVVAAVVALIVLLREPENSTRENQASDHASLHVH